MTNKPWNRQVGGSHYKQYEIQPFEFFYRNNIPHHKAAIIRRILRYDHPTGKGMEDLDKIIHEIELIKDLMDKNKEEKDTLDAFILDILSLCQQDSQSVDFNLNKTVEECSELITAIQHLRHRKEAEYIVNTIEETIDVLICILTLMARIFDWELLKAILKSKLERFEGRVCKEEKTQ